MLNVKITLMYDYDTEFWTATMSTNRWEQEVVRKTKEEALYILIKDYGKFAGFEFKEGYN